MKLRDIMNNPVKTIQAGESLVHAASLMRDEGVGVLPVYQGKVLVGMLTDRDVVIRAVAKGADSYLTKVQEAMTWGVETCREDCDLEDAIRVMEQKRVRRLAVLDGEGRLAGILSLSDIAMKTHDAKTVEEVLEIVNTPQPEKETETYDQEAWGGY